MVKKTKLDLINWSHGEILESLKKIKKDSVVHSFKFGAILVCTFFYLNVSTLGTRKSNRNQGVEFKLK